MARKAEIKKQRDDYESMIKANYNRFKNQISADALQRDEF